LDFEHFDWVNGTRLSADIPAATIYGQGTPTNKVSCKLYLASDPARKMDEKNHLAAKLNKAEIAAASLRYKSKLFRIA